MRKLLAGIVATLLLVSSANAALLINSLTITANGANFDWTYQVALQPDANMRQNSGEQPPRENDFFTIYDFGGLVNVSLTSLVAGRTFTPSTQAIGITPLTSALPDGGESNVTVRLTAGGDILGAAGSTNLFTLTLTSSVPGGGASGVLGYYAAQSQLKTNLTTADNQGRILVPIPEPTSLAMLGLVGALILRRR